MLNAIYKIESGAAKKRKKDKELEYWQSMNGPVITTKAEDDKATR